MKETKEIYQSIKDKSKYIHTEGTFEEGKAQALKQVMEIIGSYENEENRSSKHIAFFNALHLIKLELKAELEKLK